MTFEEFKSLPKMKFKDNVHLTCDYCNNHHLKTYRNLRINFVRNPNSKNYCCRECANLGRRVTLGMYICKNCQISYKGHKDLRCQNTFCSHKCATIFNNKARNLTRIHKTRKKYPRIKRKLKQENIECKNCQTEFTRKGVAKYCTECHKIALQRAGCRSAEVQSQTRRSKNEMLFAELCSQKFSIETNKPIFNGWDADVIIPEKKVAVLWNGKWHYSQISKSRSLLQIQNRDRIKLQEIENAGYTPYIVKDMGKHDPIFVNSEFEKFCEWLTI